MDKSAYGRPINFRVVLPASWSRRGAQSGGGGFNGTIPNLTGGEMARLLREGFATYGSDSGHQQGREPEWTLSDEAIKNLGYMQLKKTHDAALTLIQRMYGEFPRFNYFIGTSQGGREALTVAQRYPQDYNGIAANVPIVSFSSLMLGPELIRIQEKPMANWVTLAKVNAIRGEFVRQCDKLDGLIDGIMNNYMACRAIFDVSQGEPGRNPWAAKRCPNNVDPNPADTTNAACLTDGQISTLKVVYGRYPFATPLANGVKTFGMWVPTTDPSGSGLILRDRFVGQEGAPANATMHSHLGVLGVTGFLMRERQRKSARLHRRGSVERSTGGAVGVAGRNESGPGGILPSRRQDDCGDRDERHARFAGFAARLLPVASRQNGPHATRCLCTSLCRPSGRPWPQRNQLLSERRWRDHSDGADTEFVGSRRSPDQLGGARSRTEDVGDGHGRGTKPSVVFLSEVPEVHYGTGDAGGVVWVRVRL